MKKYFFILTMSLLIALSACSAIFSQLFEVAKKDFLKALAGFIVVVWQGFEIKYALKPYKDAFKINSVKLLYQHLGKLHVYRIQCWVLFVVFLLLAIPNFFSGIYKII